MAKLGDHPGFQAVQKHISEMEGLPMKDAGAILASKSRSASSGAKKKNPRLNKVGGTNGAPGKSPTTNVSNLFKQR